MQVEEQVLLERDVMSNVHLRKAVVADLDSFFKFQMVPEANEMAAFTAKDPTDREAYVGAWTKRLDNPSILLMAIEYEGNLAGSVASFEMGGQREITYWLGRDHWGKGIATQALTLFLGHDSVRPLHGRVAKHNHGSCRVLEKCGFERMGDETGFSEYLQRDVEEWVYRLG